MRIVQLSDFHLRGDGKLSFQKADTILALNQTIEYFNKMRKSDLPEFFVITGDLADGGTKEGYELIFKNLEKLPCPYFILPGNHDKREFFLNYFKKSAPVEKVIEPFICYTINNYPIQIIVVDTSKPNCHFGGLEDRVANWLEKKIEEYPEKPTLVFTHHPPFVSGLSAMDEGFENADRFAEILNKHKNVRLCCGHMHTGIFTIWKNIPCVTCPPVAMLMEIDFRTKEGLDVTEEEKLNNYKGGGDRFFLGNPAYLIHDLQEETINTHYVIIPGEASYSGPWPFKYYDGEK